MSVPDILLWFFGFAAVVAVVIMIINTNVLHAALSLTVCLLSVAGIYALRQAEFLAITQLLIYAVGILILILFGIMLTNRISGKPVTTASHQWMPGILVAGVLFSVLIISYTRTSFSSAIRVSEIDTPIRQAGKALMSTHMIAFEVSGVLLLVCLIGASLTASYFKKNT